MPSWLSLCQDEPGSVFCSPHGGISLICGAGKGPTPARKGAELAAVSVVLLIKVLSVCVGCLGGVEVHTSLHAVIAILFVAPKLAS